MRSLIRSRYFYDLTGWSAMVLENVPGGWAATDLSDEISKQNATYLTAKEAAARARLKLRTPQNRKPAQGVVRAEISATEEHHLTFREMSQWVCDRRFLLRAKIARARALTGSHSS